jgi:carboxyl-terminal processing protease
VLAAGCASGPDRRVVRLHTTLGEEIEPDEVDDLLGFLWDRHLDGRNLDRDLAVRRGLWLLLQNQDPLYRAFRGPDRARLLAATDASPGSLARAIGEMEVRLARVYAAPRRSWSEVAERAIDAVCRRLDPHSNFFARAEWLNLTRSLTGEYSGIGILVRHADEPVVTEVFEDGPSFGILRRGDRITEVDGRGVSGMTSEEYLALIRGDAGTVVRLKVGRGPDVLEIPITRREVKARAARRVEAGPGGSVVVVSLWSFLDGSGGQVESALRNDGKPLRGVILDLRNNPGGTVTDAVDIVDLFIDRGLVITERGRDLEELFAEDRGVAIPESVPLVVLVNRFSASASELVAGALRDYGRAVVMGETTYGKGTVQEIYRFGDRGAKVTAARFYLPCGCSTQLVGVEPDVEFADAEAEEAARVAGAAGEQVLERDYGHAVSADTVPTGFVNPYDRSGLLARLRSRRDARGPMDPAVDAGDAMLQQAVRMLAAEPLQPAR